jgi:protein ImuB
MLWLCISLPQLPLEALLTEESANAVVVTACEGNVRWIINCNEAAERANLKAPMNYTLALAIHPQITMLNRKIRSEQVALERLASWAYQFSSTVILSEIPEELRLARTTCLWLEIGASLTLFGGFRHFIEQLERELKPLGYSYRLGIGPTLEGAALLARAGIRLAITSPHALFTRIRNLPLTQLTLPPEMSLQLHTAGVRTLGLLLELPRDAIARRFGPDTSDFLDRLMGETPDPRTPFRLPEKYSAHFEFEFEVKNTEALLFPLRRMVQEFAGYLRARDTGTQRFTIRFGHRLSPATEMHIGSSAPDRSADRFLALVRERMQNIELAEPTISLSLYADQFAPPTALQTDLLNRSVMQTEDLSHTLDRIAMRVGDENVYGVRPAADHRPEYSWTSTQLPVGPTSAGPHDVRLKSNPQNLQFPDRPLWLLPKPRSLESSVIPAIASGPERIEAGWWDDGDVQRDYYVVRMNSGPDLWVFKDLRTSNWYLHGFWS